MFLSWKTKDLTKILSYNSLIKIIDIICFKNSIPYDKLENFIYVVKNQVST